LSGDFVGGLRASISPVCGISSGIGAEVLGEAGFLRRIVEHEAALAEFDHTRFCAARINLIDDRSAELDILSFGVNPKPTTEPEALANFAIKFRF
jgi:hypothetical protein